MALVSRAVESSGERAASVDSVPKCCNRATDLELLLTISSYKSYLGGLGFEIRSRELREVCTACELDKRHVHPCSLLQTLLLLKYPRDLT